MSSSSEGIAPFLYGLPQEYSPSGHGPRKHGGPASSNSIGAASLASESIFQAIMRISHWALRQHLRLKKCQSSLAFMVTVMFVWHALGRTYLASSFGTALASCLYAFHALSIASVNAFRASGSPDIDGGRTYSDFDIPTYRLEEDLARTESDLEAIRKKFADLIIASEEDLSIEVMKAETPLRIATSTNSFVIDGWLPAAKVEELQASLNSLCCGLAFVETLLEEEGDEPPVLLKNPKPVKPFEFFIDLVSTPKYDEVDPTIVLFLTFPLFFGFMIGDLGFGLGLACLGAFMRLKLKDFPDLQKLGTIVLAGGIMASLFGLFVFAEAFGVPFHPPEAHPDEHSWESVANIPIHPLLDKMVDIKEMLALSLLAGWVHLTLGFVLGFVNHIRHDRKHAFAKVAWLLILLGLFIEIMYIAGGATGTSGFVNDTVLAWVPDADTSVAGINVSITALAFIVAGVIGLSLTEGPMALSEVIGLFTNLVSYTRLAALAVGKGAMALAFNTMLFPLIFESHNIGIAIAGVLALFVTQMFFVFFLGALSAGIQAIRLNYVEFFLKFFEGGGKEFSPLRYLRRHSVATK